MAITLTQGIACAGSRQTVVVWKKAGESAEDLERARAECDAELESVRGRTVRRDRLEAETAGSAFVRCMEGKGWTWETRQVGE